MLCGYLPLSYGDHTIRSPISPLGGLDGVPGSPGSGASSFSPVSEVLRAGVGLPVSRPLLWLVDGSSSFHPRHGTGLRDHASSRVPDSPVLGQMAGPCFHLSGDRAGEGLSPLALRPVRDRVNLPKSSLDPSQTMDYLGMAIRTSPLRVFPALHPVQKLALLLQDFLSTRSHPMSV